MVYEVITDRVLSLSKLKNLIFEAENSLCADNGMHPFVSGQS